MIERKAIISARSLIKIKENERAEIERQTQEFLKAGGRIKELSSAFKGYKLFGWKEHDHKKLEALLSK